MKTTRHKTSRCPHCGHKLDASSSVNSDDPPLSGDFTICWGCASPLRYNWDLTVRPCPPWELAELEPPARLRLLRMIENRRADIRREGAN